jgi:nucleotide-binding universal stress UspA family protein
MRILLAVDGSEQSYDAARVLEHLAPAEQVVALHALDVLLPVYPTMVPEAVRDLRVIVERHMREEGERLLDRIATILPPRAGKVTKRMECGSPAELIVTIAGEERIDLIVLGARGVGPVHELVLGSVSHRVLTHAPCPTLIAKGPLRSLRRVLLPVQGEDDAEAAVTFLARKPFRDAVEVTVLTVLPLAQQIWPEGAGNIDAFRETALASATSFVEEVASRLSAMQYSAKGTARIGFPSFEIIHESMAANADLILMGSRGRRGLTRFMLGSVSHAVVHRTTRPVLILR